MRSYLRRAIRHVVPSIAAGPNLAFKTSKRFDQRFPKTSRRTATPEFWATRRWFRSSSVTVSPSLSVSGLSICALVIGGARSGQIRPSKECYTTRCQDAETRPSDDLKDDLRFFPQYQAVFLYRIDAPEKAIAAIRSLEGKISETRMIG